MLAGGVASHRADSETVGHEVDRMLDAHDAFEILFVAVERR